jgi:hypothetical protein
MSSQIEILNVALRRLAEQPINSLSEGSEAADVMSDLWDIIYKQELRSYPWRWATTTAELAAIADEEPPDFPCVHQLPSDYLQMQDIIDTATGGVVYSCWDEDYGRFAVNQDEWEIRGMAIRV